mgnify:CR=1 FL=1
MNKTILYFVFLSLIIALSGCMGSASDIVYGNSMSGITQNVSVLTPSNTTVTFEFVNGVLKSVT